MTTVAACLLATLIAEGPAIGLTATPALEGGGPWFMPGVRLSLPLGGRHAIDLEGGRILGATGEFARIRTYYASQVRFMRPPSREGRGRYWLAGLRYIDRARLFPTRDLEAVEDPDVALTVGYGWNQRRRRLRTVQEVGFSGGEGFLVYATLGLQWGR
jgi:hypothetical protein